MTSIDDETPNPGFVNEVSIHVFDDNRKINKIFNCKQQLLITVSDVCNLVCI